MVDVSMTIVSAPRQSRIGQLMRLGTVDWRDNVKTASGTVAIVTGLIRTMEAERAKLVFSDPKVVERMKAAQELVGKVFEKTTGSEAPKLRLSQSSYDSRFLTFDIELEECGLNDRFEKLFLRLAKRFGFAPIVVHCDDVSPIPAYRLISERTGDWRDDVKTGSETLAAVTKSIKALEAEREAGIRSDPKMADREERLQKLLDHAYREMKNPEKAGMALHKMGYDSETLVFEINLRRCELNLRFETAFLDSAEKFGFASMVVHKDISSLADYRLVDGDGVDMLLVAGRT
jgi:hypothetical protein